MKKLSKIFVAVLFTAIAFSSCKKSSNSSPLGQSMSFTSNGTAVNFNACVEIVATVGDADQVTITGTNLVIGKPGTSSFEVEIFHDEATLKAGQVYPAATAFAQAGSSALLYFTSDTEFFVTQPGNAQGTVTLTEVTSSTIKGTFSGKLFDEGDFPGAHVLYTITNGTFTAQRSK